MRRNRTLTASSNALAISFKSLSSVLIFPTGLSADCVELCAMQWILDTLTYTTFSSLTSLSSPRAYSTVCVKGLRPRP